MLDGWIWRSGGMIIVTGRSRYADNNLSHRYFIHRKFHLHYHEDKDRAPRWKGLLTAWVVLQAWLLLPRKGPLTAWVVLQTWLLLPRKGPLTAWVVLQTWLLLPRKGLLTAWVVLQTWLLLPRKPENLAVTRFIIVTPLLWQIWGTLSKILIP